MSIASQLAYAENRVRELDAELERLQALFDSEVAQHNRDILERERLQARLHRIEEAARALLKATDPHVPNPMYEALRATLEEK